MTQNVSDDQPTEKHTGYILHSARQIWLAGLGAFAKIEQGGGKLFESLVTEGEKIEARTRQFADNTVEGVRQRVGAARGKAADTWEGLEQIFEDRVARVLKRLGVPTYHDIQELSKRVEALNESVKALTQKALPQSTDSN